MAELKIKIPEELERDIVDFPENWSKVALDAIRLRVLRRRIESKEEKELVKWSVELGRKSKKGRFERLLCEISPKDREELLGK